MDSSFFQKLQEAKAEALAEWVKQPEELIARQGRWVFSTDSYQRFLYITDCEQQKTVEIPVPLLGDHVISRVTWEGEEVKIAGWSGSFRFHPAQAFSKGIPLDRSLKLLVPEFCIIGPQRVEYHQNRVQLACRIAPMDQMGENQLERASLWFSDILLMGIYDLETEFSPDQWYELPAVEEKEEEGKTKTYRRLVWTSGKQLYQVLAAEVSMSWEDEEALTPDLDYLFSMMPWQKGLLTEEEMDLFVQTFEEFEGEALFSKVLGALTVFLAENPQPAMSLVKLFFDMKKSMREQEAAWNLRLHWLQGSLKKRVNLGQ